MEERPFRVRTITAGTDFTSAADTDAMKRGVARVVRARKAFEAAGYDVETVRVSMPPILASMNGRDRRDVLAALRVLDDIAGDGDAMLSVGPLATDDRLDAALAEWIPELLGSTRHVMCSVAVASPRSGVHEQAVRVAAEAMAGLARSTPDGRDNFRFAAAANVPHGTPFFPVSYHHGPDAIAVGLEAAPVVARVFEKRPPLDQAATLLGEALGAALADVEERARALAAEDGIVYGGIDPSPAPLGDRSIAGAIESLTGRRFGDASTLRACAIVTEALKSLRVQTCGYSGLMLPVLEDDVLAKRAGEGRYGLRDLLLYSSVCGTGLDVVPLPGDTTVDTLARIVGDVAALSVRLHKPLSARLCLVPGTRAGELATFDNPYLTDCVVFAAD